MAPYLNKHVGEGGGLPRQRIEHSGASAPPLVSCFFMLECGKPQGCKKDIIYQNIPRGGVQHSRGRWLASWRVAGGARGRRSARGGRRISSSLRATPTAKLTAGGSSTSATTSQASAHLEDKQGLGDQARAQLSTAREPSMCIAQEGSCAYFCL